MGISWCRKSAGAYDAALAAQYSIGLITLTSDQQARGDVSGDGIISAYDASWILRKAVDDGVVFPIEEIDSSLNSIQLTTDTDK